MDINKKKKTLSSIHTNTDSFENSADPDETARDEKPSHQICTVCLSDVYFSMTPRFATMGVPEFQDKRVHFRNSGRKGFSVFVPLVPPQKVFGY